MRTPRSAGMLRLVSRQVGFDLFWTVGGATGVLALLFLFGARL